MQTFKCNQCDFDADTYVGISQHYRKSHGLTSNEVRILVFNSGIPLYVNVDVAKLSLGATGKRSLMTLNMDTMFEQLVGFIRRLVPRSREKLENLI